MVIETNGGSNILSWVNLDTRSMIMHFFSVCNHHLCTIHNPFLKKLIQTTSLKFKSLDNVPLFHVIAIIAFPNAIWIKIFHLMNKSKPWSYVNWSFLFTHGICIIAKTKIKDYCSNIFSIKWINILLFSVVRNIKLTHI